MQSQIFQKQLNTLLEISERVNQLVPGKHNAPESPFFSQVLPESRPAGRVPENQVDLEVLL
jgi:hypothetical protein